MKNKTKKKTHRKAPGSRGGEKKEGVEPSHQLIPGGVRDILRERKRLLGFRGKAIELLFIHIERRERKMWEEEDVILNNPGLNDGLHGEPLSCLEFSI